MRYVFALLRGLILVSLACSASPLANHQNQATAPASNSPRAPVTPTQADDKAKAPAATGEDASKKPPAKPQKTEECVLKFDDERLCGSIKWLAAPKQEGKNAFTLTFWKADDDGEPTVKTVDPVHTLHVFLWMPDMGHGSAPVEIKREAAGVFTINNVYFIMGGKWDIRIQLLEGKEVVDEATVDITI